MRVPPPAVAASGKEAILQHMRSYKTPKLRTVAQMTAMFPADHEQRVRVFSDSESDCATSVSSDDTVDDEVDREGEDDPRLQPT
jgi:hypothetical protein